MPAGRPKGSLDSYKRTRRKREIVLENKRVGLTPLEYLLDVVNDPEVSASRRDRCAIVAARFIARTERPLGQKERLELAARHTPVDSHWHKLLQPRPLLPTMPWEPAPMPEELEDE
jgi:hypothetical protein